MHTHLSLCEGDNNAFYDPGDEYGLSKVARWFIAGLLAPRPRDHGGDQPARQLLQAARRRLRGAGPHHLGPQQPLGAGAGAGHRSRASSRRPASSTGRSTRPATPTSPSRCILAAGLKGIREGYELPPEATANVFELTPEERAGRGHPPRCPQSLSDALDLMERSELVAEALGEHIFEWFLRNKRAEWSTTSPRSPSSSSTATSRTGESITH